MTCPALPPLNRFMWKSNLQSEMQTLFKQCAQTFVTYISIVWRHVPIFAVNYRYYDSIWIVCVEIHSNTFKMISDVIVATLAWKQWYQVSKVVISTLKLKWHYSFMVLLISVSFVCWFVSQCWLQQRVCVGVVRVDEAKSNEWSWETELNV